MLVVALYYPSGDTFLVVIKFRNKLNMNKCTWHLLLPDRYRDILLLERSVYSPNSISLPT